MVNLLFGIPNYLAPNTHLDSLVMTNKLLLLSPIRFVAQLVEQLTLNQRAEGSNPSKPTLKIKHLHIKLCRCFFIVYIVRSYPGGGLRVQCTRDLAERYTSKTTV